MNGGGGYKSAEEADQASMDVEDTEWSGAESNQWKDSQPETWKVLYFLFVIILIEFSINIRTTKLVLTTSKTNFINRIFKIRSSLQHGSHEPHKTAFHEKLK